MRQLLFFFSFNSRTISFKSVLLHVPDVVNADCFAAAAHNISSMHNLRLVIIIFYVYYLDRFCFIILLLLLLFVVLIAVDVFCFVFIACTLKHRNSADISLVFIFKIMMSTRVSTDTTMRYKCDRENEQQKSKQLQNA